MNKFYGYYQRYKRIWGWLVSLVIAGLLCAPEIFGGKVNPIQAVKIFYFTTIPVYILFFFFLSAFNKVENIKVTFLKTFIIAFINIVIIYAIDTFIKPTSIFDKQTITTFLLLLLSFMTHKKH